MMAKIVQGNSFSNAVNYVLNRDEASIIATKGVRNIDKEAIIRSFETQARLVQIARPVAHISLDFSAQVPFIGETFGSEWKLEDSSVLDCSVIRSKYKIS